MLYKIHVGTAVLTFIKVRCFTQMYTEVLGVFTSSSGQGGLLTIYDPLLVTVVRTLFSPRVIILKTDATQIKLHSYRVRV